MTTAYGTLETTSVETTSVIPFGLTGDTSGANTNSGSNTITTAAANGAFDIVIRYSGDPTYQSAFTAAVLRWTQIIVADIPDVFVNRPEYNLNQTIDDLLIDATIEPIDGPGQILGEAGPVLVRSGSLIPAYGEMRFDVADVAGMFASGIWTSVILHEMGHILGIGTLWDSLHLKNGSGDYIGARGLAEYRTLSGNAGATSVPIEHDFGSGTAGAHWDEDRFNTELMTGFAESSGAMPISRMTIGSLQDMGYAVNYSAADAYSLPGVSPGGGGTPGGTLVGDAGNNILTGTAGNDTINGLGGNDTIDGGAGDDTALFSGSLGNYTVADLGLRITLSGPDGNDTLRNVEHLRFADGTVNVNDGSALFDTLFYMHENPDVLHAGADALAHYNAMGWREGRDPNPYFSSMLYRAANADVRSSGANPLTHYEQTGWKEGRDPGPNFDVKLYLIHNPDVAASGGDPLAHFLRFGKADGRSAYDAIGSLASGFDAEYYLFHNPDVAAAGANPLQHFNTYGWHEGRSPNAWFDTSGYLSHYADVAAAGANPLQHYMTFGWKEGRDPSASFDTLKYLANYNDIAAAGVNPLDHFYSFGIYEGRSAFGDGVWHV